MNHATRSLVTMALLLSVFVTALQAEEQPEVQAADLEAESRQLQSHRERALEATSTATAEALQRMLEKTRLDLDIRLIGHKSETLAATR